MEDVQQMLMLMLRMKILQSVCEQRRQQRRQQLKLPQLPSADTTDLCGFLWSRRCGVTVGERRCAPQWETAGFGVC